MELIDWNIVEIRLIQSLWEKKSVQFIANMLDRPFGVVERKIKEMNQTHRVKLFQPKTFERKIRRREKEAGWAQKQLQVTAVGIKQVDEPELITVRIDAKTIVKVRPGTDIEKLKEKFKSNRILK